MQSNLFDFCSKTFCILIIFMISYCGLSGGEKENKMKIKYEKIKGEKDATMK